MEIQLYFFFKKLASYRLYRELNRSQNNRDFGTYGESFPP